MSAWQDAQRNIILQRLHFSIPKKSKEPKDLLSLIRAEKDNIVIQLQNQSHIEDVIADKTINKTYFSEELAEPYKYLALMNLGLEYLERVADFESLEEANKVFHDKFREEEKKL